MLHAGDIVIAKDRWKTTAVPIEIGDVFMLLCDVADKQKLSTVLVMRERRTFHIMMRHEYIELIHEFESVE